MCYSVPTHFRLELIEPSATERYLFLDSCRERKGEKASEERRREHVSNLAKLEKASELINWSSTFLADGSMSYGRKLVDRLYHQHTYQRYIPNSLSLLLCNSYCNHSLVAAAGFRPNLVIERCFSGHPSYPASILSRTTNSASLILPLPFVFSFICISILL